MRKNCIWILLVLISRIAAAQTTAIQINQVGFYPKASKMAVITSAVKSKKFYIITENKKDTVFKGSIGKERHSLNSSLITRLADFSSFTKKGSFQLFVPGLGYSYVFKIDNSVYHSLDKSVIKGYYYQRSGMPIDKQYAGKWAREEGHPDTVVFIHPSAVNGSRTALSKISTPGGWYDAGDYNKYIVNSGITMGTLLSAYEDFPGYLKLLDINIPETGNKVPDIINEAVYNLRWMLSMQDPEDGGVYHKCTNAAFDAMIMPVNAHSRRFVVQKTTAATLDFVAVMVQSARVLIKFKKQYPLLSDSCMNAALKGWKWAMANGNIYYDQTELNKTFQPSITTGAYGDNNVDDEWLWSAAELFAATGDKKYLEIVKQKIPSQLSLASWNNVSMLGCYTLVRFQKLLKKYDSKLYNALKESIVNFADQLQSNVTKSAFATVMGQSRKDYIWGSNAVAANQGILLINAYLLTKNKKYIRGALTNLDYILGRNATGFCFVTGIGSRSPMHPHHRPSIADGIEDPIPGLLVGGPNPGQQDKCKYDFFEPETSYADIACAYASNEIAINWNAPLVYLVTAIEALQ